MDDASTTEEMIGSPGIVVEIDESKFSKLKHQRGKCCGDGSWIFGGIERTDEKRFFAVPAMKRDTETLLLIARALTHLESIIAFDEWGTHGNIKKID